MTKKTINLGSVVDDSTGDYLREGGVKINENFEDAYSNLGDGTEFHPAGAWKTRARADGASFTPEFGKQYNINTLGGSISITLPKGSAADYGRVIKLRDVHASWGTNPVTIKPTSGDSLGGSTNPVVFNGDFTTLEFVYSSPATWRYVSNMKLDSLPKTSGAGVIVKTFKVTASAYVDGFFTNISATGYNTSAVQVYRNGTLLTYDPTSNFTNSDYGSKSGTDMVELNGIDIYIPYVVNGDVVTVISYTKDVTAAPVSYVRYDVLMIDPNWNPATPVLGQSMLVKSDGTYTLTDLGRPGDEEFNPNAFQLLLNGTLLVQSGKATLSPTGNEDYTLKTDGSGKWNTFTISPELANDDILTVVYFNNELGSILGWEGVDGIKTRSSQIFLNTEYRFTRSNKIRYTNTAAPSAATAVEVPGSETNIRFENVVQLLESIYPVGSVYINANNPNNPASYMGFGQWAAYGKGRAIFGFDGALDSQGNPDPLFGVNDAVVDVNGVPLKVAGNEIGQRQIELMKENIPQLESSVEFMKSGGTTGDINLSGCVPMPGGDTAPLATYQLETAVVNAPAVAGQKPTDITIIPPGITAYMWVRVA